MEELVRAPDEGKSREDDTQHALSNAMNAIIEWELRRRHWLERQEPRGHEDQAAAKIFFILDLGSPTSVWFKLMNYSRTIHPSFLGRK